MDPLRARRVAIAAIVAVVVLGRVGLVLAVTWADPHRSDSGDKSSYVEPARSLLHDHEFDRAAGSSVPEFLRTPGYPAFVATIYGLSGESDTVVYLVQAVLSGLSVLLAILLGRRLAGSWLVGLVAGLALALDPVQAATQGFIGTEALATVLTALTVYAGVRFAQSALAPRWGVAYGLALAAATYVRPTTFYFCAIPAAVLAWKALRDRVSRPTVMRGALAMLVPCVALLGTWNVRNHQEVGSWRFSAVESVNLYWYRAAGLVATRDHISFEEARLRLTEDLNRDRVPTFDNTDYADYTSGQLPPAWEHRQGEYYGNAQRAGFDLLRSEPGITAEQAIKGVYSQLVQSGWASAFSYITGHRPPTAISAAGLVVVWATEALALLGMVVSLRKEGRGGGDHLAHVLTIALLAYTILAGAGPEAAAGARFRVPVWPIWCIYAAIGLSVVVRRWHLVGRTTTDPAAAHEAADQVVGAVT